MIIWKYLFCYTYCYNDFLDLLIGIVNIVRSMNGILESASKGHDSQANGLILYIRPWIDSREQHGI